MADHDVRTPEPVAIAQAVTILLSALVTAGWITLDDTTVSMIATVVALVLSAIATLWARGRVTPLAGGWQKVVAELVRVELERALEALPERLSNISSDLAAQLQGPPGPPGPPGPAASSTSAAPGGRASTAVWGPPSPAKPSPAPRDPDAVTSPQTLQDP